MIMTTRQQSQPMKNCQRKKQEQKTNLRKYFPQLKKRFPSVDWRMHHLPDKINGLQKKSVDITLNFKIFYLITLILYNAIEGCICYEKGTYQDHGKSLYSQ